MPLQATSGAATYDAFGGGVPFVPTYIEDVFQTWLYSGNNTSQTITNGIDLSGKGGMVWIKTRNVIESSAVVDTARGASNALRTNAADASINDASRVSAFTASGFTVGNNGETNGSGTTYASWAFREQSKFFDVVTWTGNGEGFRSIPHNLGSVPGCFFIKSTTNAEAWIVYHRSLGTNGPYQRGIVLNTSAAATNLNAVADISQQTSTNFVLGDSNLNSVNGVGQTYVAYLFAHDAGGFGLTGTDNVITCGSYTGNGSTDGPIITLGYEPQWVLIKRASGAANWEMYDTMRGFTNGGFDNALFPNLTNAENTSNAGIIRPLATGFQPTSTSTTRNASGSDYIYIAIRRGPMKVPTTGTSVFTPYQVPASPTTGAITGFVTDAGFIGSRAGADKFLWGARLMGNPTLNSTNTNAQSANTNQIWDRMNGWWNTAINNYMTWGFARAPSFMDVVCWTTTGSNTSINHNLGVQPEMIIYKDRDQGFGWYTYHAALGAIDGVVLNSNVAQNTYGVYWGNTAPTATTFVSGSALSSPALYVAYLFASCPGVSKVGSFTGTGATQVINCGFTGGARFVLIKATSTTGNWLFWDSARGIVSGNDPYLLLNSTAAEVTNTDWVDTAASGFELSNAGGNLANSNGVTYIFLAIA